jgi:hypothetical protein
MMLDLAQRNFVVAVVEGDEAERDPSRRALQHPRAYYRDDDTQRPILVAK